MSPKVFIYMTCIYRSCFYLCKHEIRGRGKLFTFFCLAVSFLAAPPPQPQQCVQGFIPALAEGTVKYLSQEFVPVTKMREPQPEQTDGPELSKAWAEVCQESYEMRHYVTLSNLGTQSWVTCISPAAHNADSPNPSIKTS